MATPEKQLEQEKILQDFTRMTQYLQALKEKLFQLTTDLKEHQRVSATLEASDAERTAYRLIGDVLVKQSVGDVRPYLATTIDTLQEMIRQLEAQVDAKTREVQDYQDKYKISYAL